MAKSVKSSNIYLSTMSDSSGGESGAYSGGSVKTEWSVTSTEERGESPAFIAPDSSSSLSIQPPGGILRSVLTTAPPQKPPGEYYPADMLETSDSMDKPKNSRDPVSHRLIEKKRRDRMNNCLTNLSKLIPQTYLRKARGRVEKTEIIEMAIRYIKQAQAELKGDVIKPDKVISSDEIQNAYQHGLYDAIKEVFAFINAMDGHVISDNLKLLLLTHINKTCSQKMTLSNTLVTKLPANSLPDQLTPPKCEPALLPISPDTSCSKIGQSPTDQPLNMSIKRQRQTTGGDKESLSKGDTTPVLTHIVTSEGDEKSGEPKRKAPMQSWKFANSESSTIQQMASRSVLRTLLHPSLCYPRESHSVPVDINSSSDLDGKSKNLAKYGYSVCYSDQFAGYSSNSSTIYPSSPGSSHSYPSSFSNTESPPRIYSPGQQNMTHNQHGKIGVHGGLDCAVPIFVLDPSSTFYFPLNVPIHALEPYFPAKSALENSGLTTGQLFNIHHPVTIPVNFCPFKQASLLSDYARLHKDRTTWSIKSSPEKHHPHNHHHVTFDPKSTPGPGVVTHTKHGAHGAYGLPYA